MATTTKRETPPARAHRLAIAVAGAAGFAELAERLAEALEAPVRVWIERDGALEAAAEYPPFAFGGRDARRRRFPETPARAGEVVSVALRSAGTVVGALEASGSARTLPRTLADAVEMTAARVAALRPQEEADRGAASAPGAYTQSVVDTFAGEAKRVLDHDRLSVYLLTPNATGFERLAVATSPVIPGESEVIPIEDIGLAHVLRTNQPLVSSDLATDKRIEGKEDALIARAGFHGLLSVPLRIGGRAIGVLNFVSRIVGFYSDADVPVAQQMADLVAAFFDNLRLEQHTRASIERQAVQHERIRIALELHDTLAQSLAEASTRLSALTERVEPLDHDAAQRARRLQGDTARMLDDLRRSLLRLRPAELEEHTLEEAIRAQLESLEREQGIKTSFERHGDTLGLPLELQSAALRICQEALTNARRHARPTRIAVRLRADDELALTVEDDGGGFAEGADAAGFGLRSMRDRAEAAGGRVILTSTPGRGAAVHLSLPLPERGAPEVPVKPVTRRARSKIIRVLLVDDHVLFLDALRELLDRDDDIRVVGDAHSAAEAVAAAKRLRPDVVLLDMELPDACDSETITRLHEVAPDSDVLVVSAYAHGEQVLPAMKAGARGYVSKGTDRKCLIAAVRAVAEGSTFLDASSGSDLWGPRRPAELTTREIEVMKLVASGKTNAEIARELCIATKTVERAVAGAVSKLGARNRAHGVARAIALRLVDAPA